MDKQRRFVFGEVAELYDEARPGYPVALFDDLGSLGGLGPDVRVLEVGAGTGKATVELGRRGSDVTALEPSQAMAAVARRRCADLPNVHVEVSTFEDWAAPAGSYDLIAAAQSWHWVEEDVGFSRAAELLSPGGWLALFWNSPVERGGAAAGEIDAAYEEHAPPSGRMASQWAGGRGSKAARDWGADLAGSGLFGDVVERHRRWTTVYSTEEYLRLMRTHSDHRLLEEERREPLLAALGRIIDRHGGAIEVVYVTDLYAAPTHS
ncbi:MAG: class I SAM-dependent methyltransferase [Nitriliruptorales bacterium]